MRAMCQILLAPIALLATSTLVEGQVAGLSFGERITHVDPADYEVRPCVHAGTGPMNYG